MSPMAVSTLLGLLLTISRTMASSQFVIIEQKLTYKQASDYCAREYGTTLATIRNDYDARDLLELKQDLGGDHTWVGLTMNSGEWKWDSGFECDGDCLNLKWWDVGQPNKAAEKCTIINGNRNEVDELLHDVTCTRNDIKDFACDVPVMGKRVAALEAGLSSVNSDVDAVESGMGAVKSDVDVLETEMDTVQSDVDSVEDDVVSVQNAVDALEGALNPLAVGRYQVIDQTKTYQQASDYCKANYGTTLATIRSDDDMRDLLKLQLDLGDKHVWIGLRDSGEWKWDSGFNCGGDCEDLKWWDNGQPQNRNNGRDEDCAVMHGSKDTIDRQFHDVPCTKWTAGAFACDSPVMGPRMAAVETGLTSANSKVSAVETGLRAVNSKADAVASNVQSMNSRLLSLERIMEGIDKAIDREQGVAAPVGFGVFGDYVLYALVLLNLVVLLGLFAFCMVRRVPTKVQYGRVYDTEMDKL